MSQLKLRPRGFRWVIFFIICGCNNLNNSNIQIESLFNEYHKEYLALYPSQATEIGVHDFDSLYEVDISEDHRTKAREFYRGYQTKLNSFHYDELTIENKFSYDILSYNIETGLDELNFPDHLIPFNHTVNCVPAEFANWGSGESAHPFNSVQDYDNFLSRMEDFTVWIDTSISNMKTGIDQEVVLPKIVCELTIERIRPLAVEKFEESEFYHPIQALPVHFTEFDKKRLRDNYKNVAETTLLPAYQRLLDFLQREYLPNTRETLAWSDLPSGEEWYAFKLKKFTTANLTANEIHQLGIEEVSRISKLYEERLSNRSEEWPLHFFYNEDSLAKAYQNIYDGSQAKLDSLFGITPKTDLEIRPSTLGSYYEPGSLDGSRSGIFYFYAYNLSENPDVVSEALFLHEAVPGHHYQIAIQRESNLPDFRKSSFYSAFMEGWGLYAESLGSELNLFRDPRQKRWKLESELWRAIRLVVDTGIHHLGWSIEDCQDYVAQYHFGQMTREFQRYVGEPGQATSYKVGELKILELKEQAKTTLEDTFDPKEFHYEILSMGAVPLTLFEQRINHWIQEKSK
ncbi:DUF885 domain-containing protein [Ekhidna sp.]|uniref:DUF885 domain-containing protein n=1 Tax=Ekhidna sp. TaxID=2608089 RepID=UPI0032989062